MTVKNRKLSRAELIKVNDLLKQHLETTENEGFVKYKDGWSDAEIAKAIHPDIQPNAVGNARLELFGRLAIGGAAAAKDNLIKEMQTVIKNLVDCYGELEIKHNRLIDNIMANKVITNIGHLKTTVKEKPNG